MTRTALVTGTSSGIGEEVARRMLARGWRVVGMARREAAIDDPNFETVAVDLLNEAATEAAAREVAARHEITCVVHNAGLLWPNPLAEVTAAEIAGMSAIHLTAPLLITQALLPRMRAQRFGRIVFVSSRAAMGMAGRTAYAASKAGVHAMARSWALELAREGITVNVVAPGPILTQNMTQFVPQGSETFDKLTAQLPVGRVGTVEDVARAVMFFAEDEASFVTGQVLFVCGGASLGGLSL